MSTVNVTNLAGPSGTGTAATLASINGGPLAGMRNAIINGNFDIWQRGTTNGSTSGGFLADRFRTSVTGSSISQSQQAFTLGQTSVPGEPRFFWQGVVTSVAGSGNLAALVQPIEDVRTFGGQQVTLSFWAKADASKNMAVEFTQNFGSGGSPSATVTGLGVTTCALTTNWQKFTVTTTLPSLSGKTIGTAGDHYITVIFWFDAGSSFNARTNTLGQQNGTFDIAQVQVEAGPVATPFERRSYGQELALCQRYYQKSYDQGTAPAANDATGCREALGNGSGVYSESVTFPVVMRSSPTITLYGPTGAASSLSVGSTVGQSGFFVTQSGGTTNSSTRFHYVASIEL